MQYAFKICWSLTKNEKGSVWLHAYARAMLRRKKEGKGNSVCKGIRFNCFSIVGFLPLVPRSLRLKVLRPEQCH